MPLMRIVSAVMLPFN